MVDDERCGEQEDGPHLSRSCQGFITLQCLGQRESTTDELTRGNQIGSQKDRGQRRDKSGPLFRFEQNATSRADCLAQAANIRSSYRNIARLSFEYSSWQTFGM